MPLPQNQKNAVFIASDAVLDEITQHPLGI
jgi:hypothetical protein